ncbi:glycosyltransferase family protein [Azospirillum sp. sgz301742]
MNAVARIWFIGGRQRTTAKDMSMDGAQNLSIVFQAAAMRHRLGDFEGSASLCQFGLCTEPGQADFWLLAGTAPVGASAKRHGMLARALRLRPDHADTALAFAELVAGNGDVERSLTLQRHTLVLDPAHPDALAHHGESLRMAGRGDTAIRTLRRAIALSPGQPELHVLLGGLLLDAGDVTGAEEAFRAAAGLCPGWGLPRLHLWHLVIDSGRIDEALEYGQRLASDCPQYAEEVLSKIALHQAKREQWAAALATYQRLAAIVPEVRAMLGDALFAGHDVGACDAAVPQGGDVGVNVLPPMAGRFAAAYGADGWQGQRILVLMPKHIGCDPRAIEHDLSQYLTEAAKASGLEVLFIAADEVSYPVFMTPERRSRSPSNLRSIAARILEFMPDVVVLDCNSLSDGDTINHSWLRVLQEKVPFKIVGVVPDNHGPGRQRVEHWAAAVDAFVHFEPGASGHSGPCPGSDSDKMILTYVPVPDYFHSDSIVRDMGGIFVGSPSGNGLGHRALWLSALKTRMPECRLIMGNRFAATSPNLTEYARLHGRTKVSFNFGRRPAGTVIVTGRTYESIRAGCLLLEQAGSRLGDFFVEGKHFATFRNADEMIALGRHFLNNDDLRTTMAADAQAFMQENYAPKFFWPYVLSRLEARHAAE